VADRLPLIGCHWEVVGVTLVLQVKELVLSVCRYKFLVLFLCLFLPGCGEPALEDISGKVTFGGTPVIEGMITFFKPSSGEVAQSILGEGGRFILSVPLSGALTPGEYKVMITPLSVRDPSGDSIRHGEKIVEKGGKSIPMHYRQRNKTPLRATIPSDDYNFDMVP